MTARVYKQPARKSPVVITQELRDAVLDGLKRTSGQKLARELGVSQSTISRIAREADHA